MKYDTYAHGVLPPTRPSRRSVLSAAAWTAPAVVVASAAPAFAASGSVTVAWTATASTTSFRVLDGGTVTSGQPVVVPIELTVEGGATGLPTSSVSVTVSRPSLNIPVGRARGFGVYSLAGVVTGPSSRTAVYQRANVTNVPFGFPLTTYAGLLPAVAAGGTATFPIEFGLAGVRDLVSIGSDVTFPVTIDLVSGATQVSAATSITVPVGSGIL